MEAPYEQDNEMTEQIHLKKIKSIKMVVPNLESHGESSDLDQ